MRQHTKIPGLRITTDVSGGEQEDTFMNATLQGTRDGKFDFSIATYIEIPDEVAARGEEAIATHIDNVLGDRLGDGVEFDVQVGISTHAERTAHTP